MTVRDPNSEVPDLDNGLWERVRDAVAAETGADKSLWNGRIDYTDPDKRIRGSASADGTMRLSEKLVVKPLQDLYEKRGQPSTLEERAERRNALKTAGHEFSHLTAPQEHQYSDRLAGMQQTQYKPIEEGVTEAWSYSQVDKLADRVLPPDLAAEVKSVRGPQSYPGWAPAAETFAEQVGAAAGLDGDEVLRQMNKEARTEKAQVAADLLFENSDLPELVPEAEQAAVRDEIRAEIDQGFADLQPLNADTSINRREVSGARGVEIAYSAIDKVQEAEQRYSQGPEQEAGLETTQEAAQESGQETAQESAQETAQESGQGVAEESGRGGEAGWGAGDLSALPPPNAADQRQGVAPPTDPRIAFAQQSPAAQQQALAAQGQTAAQQQAGQQGAPQQGQQGQGGQQDREVAGLRAVLDHQAPAAGATRVQQGEAAQGRGRGGSGGEQGASRSTGPAGRSTSPDVPAR